MSEIKLGKCPNCKTAFYIKTNEKISIELVCPVCNVKVIMELKPRENGKDGVI